MEKSAAERRKKELAMIHIAKQRLGLDEALYRDFLREMTGAASAADLDDAGRRLFLAALRGRGAFRTDRNRGKPHNFNDPAKRAMMGKIGALLADMGLPWSYADEIAKSVCKVDSLTFVPQEQLYKIISALVKRQRRIGGNRYGEPRAS